LNLAKAGNICLKKIAGHLMRIFDLVDFAVGAVKEDIRSYGDSLCFEQEDIDANIFFSEWLEEYEGTYSDKSESPFENKTKRRHEGIQGQSKGKRRKQSVLMRTAKPKMVQRRRTAQRRRIGSFNRFRRVRAITDPRTMVQRRVTTRRRRGWSLNNGNNRKETDGHMIQMKRARPKMKKLSRMRGEAETLARKEKLAAIDKCLSSKSFKPWKT
jgi:hypothetical protein